jgi:Serine incorporator (Serinc)
MGLSYCFCTAAGSLCNSCFGSTAEGTTGRKRSVLLLTMAIAAALYLQYAVGPAIVSQSGWIWKTYRLIPGLGQPVYRAWYDSCARYSVNSSKNDDDDKMILLKQCAGNAGAYRPMAVATFFFAIMAVAAKVQPSLNREAWPAKYTVRVVCSSIWIAYCSIRSLFENWKSPFF